MGDFGIFLDEFDIMHDAWEYSCGDRRFCRRKLVGPHSNIMRLLNNIQLQ